MFLVPCIVSGGSWEVHAQIPAYPAILAYWLNMLERFCSIYREGGMDVSLFKRLSERHPHAVVSLEHQYRMNEDIMELSNTLIYEHRLKCGTQGVARAVLELPNWDEFVCYMKENTANIKGMRHWCSQFSTVICVGRCLFCFYVARYILALKVLYIGAPTMFLFGERIFLFR